MNEPKLSMETEFQLAVFDKAVEGMTTEQAKDYLKRAHRLYIGMRELYLRECERNLPQVRLSNESDKRPTTNPFRADETNH